MIKLIVYETVSIRQRKIWNDLKPILGMMHARHNKQSGFRIQGAILSLCMECKNAGIIGITPPSFPHPTAPCMVTVRF
jgi:hypothetical protein